MNEPTVYVTYCPGCKGRTQFELVHDGQRRRHVKAGYAYGVVLVAVECIVCRTILTGMVDDGNRLEINLSNVLTGKEFPGDPERIARAASEAHRSLQATCLRGAGILARAVIEATAKDNGITNGTVAVKIRQTQERGLIRQYVRDGADEVRLFGNEMAHGDFPDQIEIEDVRLALELMDEVLEEVYQAPARVENARKRRAKEPDGTADR